jgi:hypothetical protein
MQALLKYGAVAVGAVAIAAGLFVGVQWITDDEPAGNEIMVVLDRDDKDCEEPGRMNLRDGAGALVDRAYGDKTSSACEYRFVFKDVPDLPRYKFAVQDEDEEWSFTRHLLERRDWHVRLVYG